ncbi:Rho guanine nucleotide exchange factor [Marasmius tenuissimus]|nr:Rho guanine nucleotide exchange factor [Marasmius tenuissimus]
MNYGRDQNINFGGNPSIDFVRRFTLPTRNPNKILWDAVANVGASHNAEQQYSRGECLPGTRENALSTIHEWGHAKGKEKPLCWLTGAAGVGKTAIAMSVAKACEQKGRLVSSFFFFRSDPKRNNPHALWLTTAHGLASTIPSMRRLIERRISEDPKILEARMEDQFRELIFDPIGKQSGLWAFPSGILSLISSVRVPNIVIIDGLDECGDEATQLRILSTIRDAFQQGPHFPLRFLICSRPEAWIQELFTSEPFRSLSMVICLDDEFTPDEDIATYCRHQFQSIVSDPKYDAVQFPNPWPSQNDFATLVNKSCNQFVYLATAFRFMTSSYLHPIDTLHLILDNSAANRPGVLLHLELDALYNMILEATHDPDRVHAILVAILVLPTVIHPDVLPKRYLAPTPAQIELLLGLSSGQVALTSRELLSVLDIRGPEDKIRINHTSFRDYLVDQNRSQRFHVDLVAQGDIFAQRRLKKLSMDEMQAYRSSQLYKAADPHEDSIHHEEPNTEEHFDDDEEMFCEPVDETDDTDESSSVSENLPPRIPGKDQEHEEESPSNCKTHDGNFSKEAISATGKTSVEHEDPQAIYKPQDSALASSSKGTSPAPSLTVVIQPPADTLPEEKKRALATSKIVENKAEPVKIRGEKSPTEVTGPAEGLRMDEESERVQAFLKDDEKCQKVLDTRDDEAQRWLDLLQALTAYPGIARQLRSTIFKMMLRLSRESGMCPRCLKINNVEKLDEYPVAEGHFGSVYKGEIAAEIVCLKVVKVYQSSDVQQAVRVNEFMREAIVWQQLKHPNILPFIGMYYLDKDHKRLCLVSPWMEQGNLVTFLEKAPPALVDRMLLASDIASGLAHLHDMSIVHGDMKGLNVLITPELRACIGDFGLSRVRDSHALRLATTIASRASGTTRWLSPELLDPDSPSFNSTFKSDMYAYGCVCYEIFAGSIPFHELPSDGAVLLAVVFKKRRPSRPEGLEDDAIWKLMTSCWNSDPSLRPAATDALEQIRALSSKVRVEMTDAPDWKAFNIDAIRSNVDYPPLDLEMLAHL